MEEIYMSNYLEDTLAKRNRVIGITGLSNITEDFDVLVINGKFLISSKHKSIAKKDGTFINKENYKIIVGSPTDGSEFIIVSCYTLFARASSN